MFERSLLCCFNGWCGDRILVIYLLRFVEECSDALLEQLCQATPMSGFSMVESGQDGAALFGLHVIGC